MKCQKCGAELAENSKFCEFCGNPVSQPEQVNSNINNNNDDLGQTVRIDPVVPNEQNMVNQEVQNNQMPNQMNNTAAAPGKKNNKLLFIIGGAVLAVVAIVVVVFAFIGSSGNSIETLEKAMANFEKSAKDSATIDAKLAITSAGQSLSLSATAKFQKTGDKSANFLVKVNESMLFDEMNIYASVSEKEATAYVESTLLDMMGTTSSLTPMWVYYTLPLDELTTEETTSKMEELTLKDILDEEHFVYVDKKDGLKHYQLIIDQKLIENMQKAVEKVAPGEISDATETLEPLTETLKIDFYITNSDELKKIELNMSEFLQESAVSEMIFSIEFSDLNNTVVEIPADAKNSTTTIDAYMSEYAIIEDDFGFGTDFGFDSDLDGGFDDVLDYDNGWDYESDWDTSFDWDYEDSYDSGTDFGI